jgi:hypothetical protein
MNTNPPKKLGYDLEKIINTLEKDSLNLIDWFSIGFRTKMPNYWAVVKV